MCAGIHETHNIALSLFEYVDKRQDFEYLDCAWSFEYESPIPGSPGVWLYRSYKLKCLNLDLSIHIRQNRSMYFFVQDLPISYSSFIDIVKSYLWKRQIADLYEFRL